MTPKTTQKSGQTHVGGVLVLWNEELAVHQAPVYYATRHELSSSQAFSVRYDGKGRDTCYLASDRFNRDKHITNLSHDKQLFYDVMERTLEHAFGFS